MDEEKTLTKEELMAHAKNILALIGAATIAGMIIMGIFKLFT